MPLLGRLVQHPVHVVEVQRVGCAVVARGREGPLSVAVERRVVRILMLDEIDKHGVEASHAPVFQIQLCLLARELHQQRPRRVSIEQERLARSIHQVTLCHLNA